MTGETTSAHNIEAGFVHEALMYRTESELRDAVAEFLAAARVAHEPVLMALPSATWERLRESLGDIDASFADMEEVGRNPSCLLPMIEDWMNDHGGRARVVSEAVWPGRSYPETAECLRHEALLNQALADADAAILSPYDAAHLDSETLAGAEMTHQTVLEGGRRRVSASYDGSTAPARLGDVWPLESPSEPVFEHRLDGSLHDLRHEVAEDPLVGELTADRRSDLVFAVNEAATNAIRHGDGGCTTRIWHDGRSVVTEVSFEASLDDPLAGRRRPDADAIDGRGLWLINQVCDLVELRSSPAGTTLRMHVRNH